MIRILLSSPLFSPCTGIRLMNPLFCYNSTKVYPERSIKFILDKCKGQDLSSTDYLRFCKEMGFQLTKSKRELDNPKNKTMLVDCQQFIERIKNYDLANEKLVDICAHLFSLRQINLPNQKERQIIDYIKRHLLTRQNIEEELSEYDFNNTITVITELKRANLESMYSNVVRLACKRYRQENASFSPRMLIRLLRSFPRSLRQTSPDYNLLNLICASSSKISHLMSLDEVVELFTILTSNPAVICPSSNDLVNKLLPIIEAQKNDLDESEITTLLRANPINETGFYNQFYQQVFEGIYSSVESDGTSEIPTKKIFQMIELYSNHRSLRYAEKGRDQKIFNFIFSAVEKETDQVTKRYMTNTVNKLLDNNFLKGISNKMLAQKLLNKQNSIVLNVGVIFKLVKFGIDLREYLLTFYLPGDKSPRKESMSNILKRASIIKFVINAKYQDPIENQEKVNAELIEIMNKEVAQLQAINDPANIVDLLYLPMQIMATCIDTFYDLFKDLKVPEEGATYQYRKVFCYVNLVKDSLYGLINSQNYQFILTQVLVGGWFQDAFRFACLKNNDSFACNLLKSATDAIKNAQFNSLSNILQSLVKVYWALIENDTSNMKKLLQSRNFLKLYWNLHSAILERAVELKKIEGQNLKDGTFKRHLSDFCNLLIVYPESKNLAIVFFLDYLRTLAKNIDDLVSVNDLEKVFKVLDRHNAINEQQAAKISANNKIKNQAVLRNLQARSHVSYEESQGSVDISQLTAQNIHLLARNHHYSAFFRDTEKLKEIVSSLNNNGLLRLVKTFKLQNSNRALVIICQAFVKTYEHTRSSVNCDTFVAIQNIARLKSLTRLFSQQLLENNRLFKSIELSILNRNSLLHIEDIAALVLFLPNLYQTKLNQQVWTMLENKLLSISNSRAIDLITRMNNLNYEFTDYKSLARSLGKMGKYQTPKAINMISLAIEQSEKPELFEEAATALVQRLAEIPQSFLRSVTIDHLKDVYPSLSENLSKIKTKENDQDELNKEVTDYLVGIFQAYKVPYELKNDGRYGQYFALSANSPKNYQQYFKVISYRSKPLRSIFTKLITKKMNADKAGSAKESDWLLLSLPINLEKIYEPLVEAFGLPSEPSSQVQALLKAKVEKLKNLLEKEETEGEDNKSVE